MLIKFNSVPGLLCRQTSVARATVAQPVRFSQVRARRLMPKGAYREPDLPLKELLVATLPYIKPDYRPQYEKCTNVGFDLRKVDPVHPYHLILARELIDKWNTVPLIAIFQKNWLDPEEYRLAHNAFFKAGMKLETYNHFIYRYAFEGTHLESLLPIVRLSRHVFHRQTQLGTTSLLYFEDTSQDVRKMLKAMTRINRDYPEFILLGGVLRNQAQDAAAAEIAQSGPDATTPPCEERILSRKQLFALRDLPGLDIMRARLVHTLNTLPQALTSTLAHQSVQLSRALDHLSKSGPPLKPGETDEKPQTADEDTK